MGLFDAFKKKQCDVCGGEIGLLGNRKLEDGNLCKNCARKLSPWFDDRRHSTVEQIKEQLAYREANKEKVAAFNVTRSLGDDTQILLDEDAGLFMVARTSDLRDENPDVLAFSDVTGCRLDIDEDRTEVMRTDKDGNEVSYVPPRYTYEYDFSMIIQVRNPYFDDITFRLNSSSVEIGGSGPMRARPEDNIEYQQYKQMGEEIKEILLGARKQARETAAAAAAPKQAVVCPYCGATTTPGVGGQCEYCGGAVN
ncbi:MAG: DUF4428 domain-containing protein [Oscillospiraceae bacterium]|nr:DUF4428 domain-containing protein [Oscillospiraceae bacterium]